MSALCAVSIAPAWMKTVIAARAARFGTVDMTIKYALVPMTFNLELWADTLRAIPASDVHDFALIIGVDPSTLHNWRNAAYARARFPYPAMGNFLNACNWLDLDPRQFFTLETGDN